MSSQEIIMCCYEALHPGMNPNTVTNPTIIQGVSKLSGALRIQLTSQEDMESIYSDSSAIDWNKAFKIKSGIMLNQPVYGIVVHEVLVSDITPNQMTDSTYLYTFERENAIAHGSITKISTLRRRNAPSQYSHNSDPIKQSRHHSIVIHLTNSEAANQAIKNGICINYTQCINCDGEHEAWHYNCSVKLQEKQRNEEEKNKVDILFSI